MKKALKIILSLTVLLYLTIALYSVYTMETGEFFGYILLGVIALGIIVTIWVLVKPPQENKQQTSS